MRGQGVSVSHEVSHGKLPPHHFMTAFTCLGDSILVLNSHKYRDKLKLKLAYLHITIRPWEPLLGAHDGLLNMSFVIVCRLAAIESVQGLNFSSNQRSVSHLKKKANLASTILLVTL